MRFELTYDVDGARGVLVGTSACVMQSFIAVLLEQLPKSDPLYQLIPPFSRSEKRQIFLAADGVMNIHYLITQHRLH